MKSYYGYWGKAQKDEAQQGEPYHLLPYHSLDVVSVAAYWWDHSASLRQAFTQTCSLSERQHRAWLLFFIGLHDLGKLDIRFQGKAIQTWLTLNPQSSNQQLPAVADCRGFDHGEAGLFWFIDDYQPQTNNDFLDFFAEPAEHPYQSWIPWLEKVTGHHGFIIKQSQMQSLSLPPDLSHFAEHDKKARQQWLETLANLFLAPVGLTIQDQPPAVSPLLAGFCSIADWLGSWSNQDSFLYHSVPCQDISALQQYFNDKYQQDAKLVMDRSGLLAEPNPYRGVQALLNNGYSPRQLQVLVDELPLQAGITVIEAPTGSGKTETALAYAWRLIDQGLADSVIFALPTQATANAMLARIEKIADVLFTQPNLILAHANARFNERFHSLKQRGAHYQEQEAFAQCCQWLAQSRKRVFLGQIGVCTIDQVLVSVLPVRHRFIRGFGVGRSVLIVDEIHAYDSYMNGLLDEVLCQQAKSQRCAILLSATLPSSRLQQLLACYHRQTEPTPTVAPNSYPLVSWANTRQIRCFDLTQQPEHLPPSRQVYLEPIYAEAMLPDTTLIKQIVSAALAGAQVCIICNLVDVAQQLYQTLRSSVPDELELLLFHARFTLNDRQHKEAEILERFGPGGDRAIGRILVSTQVIEQSLDVDFDWLITQLCPADLLFQRLGRLHRHCQNGRPTGFETPQATVLLPTSPDYGLHGLIYANTRVMWRTQQHIEALAGAPLIFPNVYRQWLEAIYAEEPDADEPAWVTTGREAFDDEELKRRSAVRLMFHFADARPLPDDDEQIRAVTRDGEMSLPIIPYVATAKGKQLLDGQLLDDLDEYQQQEALICNRVNVPHSWQSFLPEADDSGVYWLEAKQSQDDFTMITNREPLMYSRVLGMEKKG